jgi:hypothetical protein
MAVTVAKYRFNSWLRKGIGAKINQVDNLAMGASPVMERATIPVDILVNSSAVHKDFALYGPGDIIGMNPKLVVRTEPLNWVTNFEPNYLPFIEFYDEDFAWRYTPASANGNKLRPWIALVVLKESSVQAEQEFTRNENRLPLPTITVKSASSLPPNNQIWAWAHVHTNESHEADSEFEEFLKSLHDLNNPASDKIISRLMSPRKLVENTAYRAFLVPTFETGRLAGLGVDTTGTDSQKPSWSHDSDGLELPIYFEWFFRTGENEDFESLVKLLEPRVMDSRVGIRNMNGSSPGFGMTNGSDIGAILPPESDQVVIGLEGALKAPTTLSRPENLLLSKPFFDELQDKVNFPAAVAKISNNLSDPVVSPPIYGENHALHHELNVHNDGWLHHLNRDPRLRVPAGFGTNVIQKNQETYMSKAWDQVQRILDANKRIFWASYAMRVASKIKDNFVVKLDVAKLISIYAPILKKVKGSPTTLHYQMQESNLPVSIVSAPFRKLIRPRGAMARRMANANLNFSYSNLVNDLNEGRISPAPPKILPVGIGTVNSINRGLTANSISGLFKWLKKYRLLLLIAALIILAICCIFFLNIVVGVLLAGLCVLGYYYLSNLKEPQAQNSAEIMNDPAKLRDFIQQVPPQPNFIFTETDPVDTFYPTTGGTVKTESTQSVLVNGLPVKVNTFTYQTTVSAGSDSVEAANFRKAAVKLNSRLSIKAEEKVRSRLDLSNAFEKMSAALDPRLAFPKQLASMVYFTFNPNWLLKPDNLVPAMAYPDFEDPMYEKLRDISSELLIPNLNLIPPNTISLLITNPEFIESYMVGLNHEFGRELLWREYPTDKRGSYFRQFWDVRGIVNVSSGLSPQEITKKYKDITPLDEWGISSKLGKHNNRNIHGDKQVVLVVRGELLKKYPNTIIYAQKAKIYKDENGVPQPRKEPVISEVETKAQMDAEIKFPLFKADIDPDYKFFGFDLSIEKAKGSDNPRLESDDWGYYFVIQQIPGDPRFGMDVKYEPDEDNSTPITWDDLSWDKYPANAKFIDTSLLPVTAFNPAGVGENRSQWGGDSATMAYILYQKPVMIAVHAREMLNAL